MKAGFLLAGVCGAAMCVMHPYGVADEAMVSNAMSLARARVDRAREPLEQRLQLCFQLQQRRVPPSVFEHPGLSQREKEVSAYVLASRAMEACVEAERGTFLYALGRYKVAALAHEEHPDETPGMYEQLLFEGALRV